jgi:hypothetical protein
MAATASVALRDELLAILGDDLVALWFHGGTTFPDRPRQPGDLDLCAVVTGLTPDERTPDAWTAEPSSRPNRVMAATQAVAAAHGVAFDTTFLVRDDFGSGDRPRAAFAERRRFNTWSVLRAHLLAGQYVHLHGAHPDELIAAPPTTDELARDLDRELEHLERHVHEGDADNPYEATYATWNGCRILHTLETGSPVISKRSAGAWGLEHLPARWHDAIRAAGRAYDGEATPEDRAVLRDNMAPFVAMVRERLPPTGPRPPGPPRWS